MILTAQTLQTRFTSSFTLPDICALTAGVFELKENPHQNAARNSMLLWFRRSVYSQSGISHIRIEFTIVLVSMMMRSFWNWDGLSYLRDWASQTLTWITWRLAWVFFCGHFQWAWHKLYTLNCLIYRSIDWRSLRWRRSASKAQRCASWTQHFYVSSARPLGTKAKISICSNVIRVRSSKSYSKLQSKLDFSLRKRLQKTATPGNWNRYNLTICPDSHPQQFYLVDLSVRLGIGVIHRLSSPTIGRQTSCPPWQNSFQCVAAPLALQWLKVSLLSEKHQWYSLRVHHSAMVEYSLDLDLPDYVFDDPVVKAMSDVTSDIMTWPNVSVEMENEGLTTYRVRRTSALSM